MTCFTCRNGETHPGLTGVTLQRDRCIVIFKDVPADVCENCGEAYLSKEVSQVLFDRAKEAVNRGAEVEILRYAA